MLKQTLMSSNYHLLCLSSQRESSHGSRVTNYHGDSDHEYLVPRPMSSVSGDSNYSHEDVDRVMKQISIAVSKSRGVSSLSRAVAKNSTTTSIREAFK